METMDVIFGRRSIRRFQQRPLERDQIERIVRAGTYAASAGNGQPWRFVAVTDPAAVNAATAALAWLPAAGEPGEGERPTAHVAVLVPRGASWAAQADAAAAIQNMMLAAADMGIGSCWFGSVRRDELAQLLGIPGGWHIYSVVALGHPAEEPQAIEAEDPAVKRDQFGRLIVPKKPLEQVMSVDRLG
jgi:nitroreductase